MPRTRPDDYYQHADRKTPVVTLFGLTRQLERIERRFRWLFLGLVLVGILEALIAWWMLTAIRL